MADTGADTAVDVTKSNKWTTEEKYKFVVQLLSQAKFNKVNWDVLKMPGRSRKALQHLWHEQVQKEILAAANADGTSTPSTPQSKRKPKATDGESIEDGDGTPSKRARLIPTPRKTTKGAKVKEDKNAQGEA
ncbi:hypothetical protein B0O99DRAFT_592949 [Bisporella sp. PMI_857]|nr:hypothetical protein B0O99DRAFT_592949 [Bisporella sp. PMI_857]